MASSSEIDVGKNAAKKAEMNDKISKEDSEMDGATRMLRDAGCPSSSSLSSEMDSDDTRGNRCSSRRDKKRSKKRSARGRSSGSTSESESESSSESSEQRKLKQKQSRERKHYLRRERKLKSKSHRRKIKGENYEQKHKYNCLDSKESRHKKRSRKHKEDFEFTSKQRTRQAAKVKSDAGDTLYLESKVEESLKIESQTKLRVTMETREQQKALILQSAELAKARLASGELQRARLEQIKMQRLYGSVDWRAKKKLKTERQRLERTVAAGRKLASMEERENARMDAFRVALGLPTAEAQRQAEWRAEATRALSESGDFVQDANQLPVKHTKKTIIGPHLPQI